MRIEMEKLESGSLFFGMCGVCIYRVGKRRGDGSEVGRVSQCARCGREMTWVGRAVQVDVDPLAFALAVEARES